MKLNKAKMSVEEEVTYYGERVVSGDKIGYRGKFIGTIHERIGRESARVWIETTFTEEQLKELLLEFKRRVLVGWYYDSSLAGGYYVNVSYDKYCQHIVIEFYLPKEVEVAIPSIFHVGNTEYIIVFCSDVDLSDGCPSVDGLSDLSSIKDEDEGNIEPFIYDGYTTVGYDGYDGYDP